jgi:hypothetical protein
VRQFVQTITRYALIARTAVHKTWIEQMLGGRPCQQIGLHTR